MSIRRWTLSSVALLGLILLSASPASACSLAREPTVREVVDGARLVFLGKVTEREENDGALAGFTFAVERVLKGEADHELYVPKIMSTGCGDGLDADVGDTVILAVGVPFYGDRVSPAWVFRENGRLRYSDVDGPGRTIDEVVASIRGDLPPTDGISPQDGVRDEGWLLLAGLGGASAWLTWRRRFQPAAT